MDSSPTSSNSSRLSPMQETVYGTNNDDNHVVVSEKVQNLAGSIYQEFQKMIAKYDEDVVKELMPLTVNVLESLDLAYMEIQEHEVELELLREDNEQLITQYEREKQLRKSSEKKLLECECSLDDDRREQMEKIESLESIVRMLELKSKNVSDHAVRLEDKENEMKKEYSKLHERYTELFKTHMDYLERTKILLGSDRLENLSNKQRLGFHLSHVKSGSSFFNMNLENDSIKTIHSPLGFSNVISPNRSLNSHNNLTSELQSTLTTYCAAGIQENSSLSTSKEMLDKSQLTEKIQQNDRGTATKGGWIDGFDDDLSYTINTTPGLEDIEDVSEDVNIGKEQILIKREQRRPNTLYQELRFHDTDALEEVDDGGDISGGYVHPGEFASADSDSETENEQSRKVTDNFFGMGKEVENLIMENNELLATKNALNIVKDDLIAKVDELTGEQEILKEEVKSLDSVKERLMQRVTELEEELKKTKEDVEKNKSDDEEDVPMAQRKRFTRVEMARVLMERNQYKERLMELQEAVRWTGMIRASKSEPAESNRKNKSSIWKFKSQETQKYSYYNLFPSSSCQDISVIFGNLFNASEKPQRKHSPYVNVHYNAPTSHVTPALDAMRKKRLGDRHKGLDFLDSDLRSEKLQQQRAKERREQYKQVRAHVQKDDGRMQAYGWSLPSKTIVPGSKNQAGSSSSSDTSKSNSSNVPVPVPIYCRPLLEKEPGMKIWCASGVNITGGRAAEGGTVIGANICHSSPGEKSAVSSAETVSVIDKLDNELKEYEKEYHKSEENLSSLVWICTSTHSSSKVTVIDANNPADILESFHVCSSHLLCITSVPGAKETDYQMDEKLNNLPQNKKVVKVKGKVSCIARNDKKGEINSSSSKIGNITFISCETGTASNKSQPTESSPQADKEEDKENSSAVPPQMDVTREDVTLQVDGKKEFGQPKQSSQSDLAKHSMPALPQQNQNANDQTEKMSSVLPTMWLGAQNGSIFVHSAVTQWKRCIHSVHLKDSVLSIVHIKGRVFAALADGTVAVFHRAQDRQWDLSNYHVLDLGQPHHSVRCMAVVFSKVWCGYRNRIHVVNSKSLKVIKSFDAHPRKESQVRQMARVGEGVWVSIRLDSTLRLYHAHTYQHLQDVDVEPYVSKMLGTGKLGFSFIRITALLVSCNRLWMGTGNGVTISVPLSEAYKQPEVAETGGKAPGGMMGVSSDSNENVTSDSFIPYCSMAQAQLSFHGHRDSVKFFVAVPGQGGMSTATTLGNAGDSRKNSEGDSESLKSKYVLVISGGEGYIDFRIGDGADDDRNCAVLNSSGEKKIHHGLSKGDRSHLIVWQVAHG
ncbi:C-Jun-amino-terminal kinase-interacting protein 4-like isoform X5 [Limulus polyphemus]|uniref:C-Jun-amino-terminal kinase-interacting protein 4-like isoform X5 n=1 Tax=Limulus polyphemus TaxID=6850 RepID=A0ABM1TBU5_LIMPO|nr:C-Jun-amino-terminal kinase-interacting protein 4-like isoform X5 [Limulus polyphemus]